MTSDLSQLRQTEHDNLQIAIETSGLPGSVAVLLGEKVLRSCKLDSGRRTAAALAPVLAETLKWCQGCKKQPQLVSIANGPGSFTGLRIGVTTAKTFSYAADLPLIAVDSLAAIAAATFTQQPEIDDLLVGLNAYRGQVFTANFQRNTLLVPFAALRDSAVCNDQVDAEMDTKRGVWSAHPDQVRVVDADQWQQILRAASPEDPVTGDRKVFSPRPGLNFIDRQIPDAVGVGLMAARATVLGAWSDPLGLVPRYLRPSAAEEKASHESGKIKPPSS